MNRIHMRIVGGALVGLSLLFMTAGAPHLWFVPDVYEASARIEVKMVLTGSSALTSSLSDLACNYVQGTIEALQSKSVLNAVITNLNLNRKWAERFNKRSELDLVMTCRLLQKRVEIRLGRRTPFIENPLIEIRVSSEGKVEAAAIANEIATVYREQRDAQERDWDAAVIKILEEELERLNQRVMNAEAVGDRLRRELDISEEDANGDGPAKIDKANQRAPYFLAKRDLEELKRVRDRWQLTVIREKIDEASKPSLVKIVDKAQPPLRPSRPNRPLGFTMLAAGAIFGFIGFWLLKES